MQRRALLLLLACGACAHGTSNSAVAPASSSPSSPSSPSGGAPRRTTEMTTTADGPSDAEHETYVLKHFPSGVEATIVFRRGTQGWEVAPESQEAWNALSKADQRDLVMHQRMAPAIREHNRNAVVFRAFEKAAVAACMPAGSPSLEGVVFYGWSVDGDGKAKDIHLERSNGANFSATPVPQCLIDYIQRQSFAAWASRDIHASFRFPATPPDAGAP